MAKLVLIRGNGDEGCAFDLDKQTTTIGRAKRSDIAIRLPTISRLHASIDNEKENGQVFLNPLSKKNFPFINSKQIKGRVQLSDGDILSFGPRKYLFRDPSKKTFGKGNKEQKIKKKVSFSDTVVEITAPSAKTSVPAPVTPANVLRHLTQASYTPIGTIPSEMTTEMQDMKEDSIKMMTPAHKMDIESADMLLDDLCEAIRTPGQVPSIPTSLVTRGDVTSVVTPARPQNFNSGEDDQDIILHDDDVVQASFTPITAAPSSLTSSVTAPIEMSKLKSMTPAQVRNIMWGDHEGTLVDDMVQGSFTPISAAPSNITSEVTAPIEMIKSKAMTPAQARKITWEMIFENQMSRSDEILKSANEIGVSASELLDACADEIEDFEVEEPCSPVKLLESEDQVDQHTPALLARPHVRRAFLPQEQTSEAAPQIMPITPGPSFRVVQSDNAASPHPVAFPSASQIQRVLAESRLERAATVSTMMSPKPARFEATIARSPHMLAHHMAAKPSTTTSSLKFASPHVGAVRHPTRLMTPMNVVNDESASSPHPISTHCPALKSLKRLLAIREGARSPSVRSKYVSKVQEKKMEEKKVSFGDVSIHSFALDLDIVPTEQDTTSFDLHMRLGHEEHSRRTLSVDEHEKEKSMSTSVAPNKFGDAKFCARLPVLSRFDRVQRSLRVVKNGEKHVTQIKQNFTEFLQNLKRKDLQSLAKEHGIKANLKTAKLVKELVTVFTAASESFVLEEEVVEEKETKEVEEEDDDEAKKVLECHTWDRRTLQNWCKRVGIKANSKTKVLIEELKAYYA